MRIHIGPPPNSPEFMPEQEGWTRLREPTPFMLQVMAAPIAITTAALLIFAWSTATPVASSSIDIEVGGTVAAVVGTIGGIIARIGGGFLLLILVHELLHAVAMPGAGLDSQTLIGVWPSRLLFYAAYLREMSRERFIGVFLVPLIVLTIVPLVICTATQTASTLIATVSIVNGACACGDLVGAGMIAWQVPPNALVRNQGWQTWWKLIPVRIEE